MAVGGPPFWLLVGFDLFAPFTSGEQKHDPKRLPTHTLERSLLRKGPTLSFDDGSKLPDRFAVACGSHKAVKLIAKMEKYAKTDNLY